MGISRPRPGEAMNMSIGDMAGLNRHAEGLATATVRIVCFGSGGHAAVLLDVLQLMAARASLEVVGLIDCGGRGRSTLGVPVIGTDDDLPRLISTMAITHFIVGVGTVRGGCTLRPRLLAQAVEAGLHPFTAIHPSAIVARSAEIGPGSAIMAGAVIQPRVRIGANVIINTRASIDHDCVIADHVHVAPGVVCSGGVQIGERAHLGTGSIVVGNLRIGACATVGAGSTLICDCPPDTTVYGSPARPTVR